MSESTQPAVPRLSSDDALIDAAVERAAREAVLRHARAGHPVATMRDGKVVWLTPEEVLARFASETGANGEPDGG